MLCPLAMAFTCYLCGSGKLNSFKFHFLDLLLSFTVFVTLPFPSHILTNLLLSGMWEAFSGCECVCVYARLCMSPYALWMQVCVCKCGCLFPLLPPFHSDNICHQLQHTPCLLVSPLLPSFSPSLPQTRAAQ